VSWGVWGCVKDEETEARPSGEEIQIEESLDFKSGVVQEEGLQLEIPQDLRGGGQEEK
jgi:hypothetical protein